MTTLDTDQGITLQVGTDPANLPSAQLAEFTGVLSRLNLRYTDTTDRTARHPVSVENEVSWLATENRGEVYDGTNWVSAYGRTLFAFQRRTTDAANINNNTGLVSDGTLVTNLPAVTGIFRWRDTIRFSSSQAADIKYAYTWAAGTAWWGVTSGVAVGATGTTGDAQFAVVTATATPIPLGGAGVGTQMLAVLEGEITLAGVAATLTLQYAQQTLDATNTVPAYAGSAREIWRVS